MKCGASKTATSPYQSCWKSIRSSRQVLPGVIRSNPESCLVGADVETQQTGIQFPRIKGSFECSRVLSCIVIKHGAVSVLRKASAICSDQNHRWLAKIPFSCFLSLFSFSLLYTRKYRCGSNKISPKSVLKYFG